MPCSAIALLLTSAFQRTKPYYWCRHNARLRTWNLRIVRFIRPWRLVEASWRDQELLKILGNCVKPSVISTCPQVATYGLSLFSSRFQKGTRWLNLKMLPSMVRAVSVCTSIHSYVAHSWTTLLSLANINVADEATSSFGSTSQPSKFGLLQINKLDLIYAGKQPLMHAWDLTL